MKLIPILSTTQDTDMLKEQCEWTIVIGDSFARHEYRFKASSHLSIAMIFGLLMTILRLSGYKK
jgi:hypothetical protein